MQRWICLTYVCARPVLLDLCCAYVIFAEWIIYHSLKINLSMYSLSGLHCDLILAVGLDDHVM